MWYEKHRPKSVEEYIWSDETIKSKLLDWISNPLQYPSLIFEGSTGTGKTSLAFLIKNILDLGTDAKIMWSSLQSGVDSIREDLQKFCSVGGFNGMKLVIMDESDRLSRDAQEMLRNVLDRYKDDVRFIFTCNNIDGIADPIKGRCWVFKIQELDQLSFMTRLVDVATLEGITVDDEQLLLIENVVDQFYPNMRGAISHMQFMYDGEKLVEKKAADHTEQVREIMINFTVDGARTFASGLRVVDYDSVYRCLYENTHWFKDESEVVCIIAEYLYRHAHAGLPDINLVSCLIKLNELI